MQPETANVPKSKNPKRPIYLDYNATTPLDPAVLKRMMPFFLEEFGNPSSSSHSWGWTAQIAVEQARKKIAKTLNVKSSEIIFTSGATESNNLCLYGVCQNSPWLKSTTNGPAHILTSPVEHKAILETALSLKLRGIEIDLVPVNSYGQVDLEALKGLIKPNTILASFMWANNEVGSLNPMKEIVSLCHQHGVMVHSDAAQAMGKIPLDLKDVPVDFLSFSGHKFYGPKGSGGLFVRSAPERSSTPSTSELEHHQAAGSQPLPIAQKVLQPMTFGGAQERGLRPGTLNVPAIVGIGEASELSQLLLNEETPRLKQMAAEFVQRLRERFDGVQLNGHPDHRIPGQLNLSFPGVPADALMSELSGLAISAGSACSSGEAKPSYVLLAMGKTPTQALSSLRLCFGRFSSRNEMVKAADLLIQALERVRS